MSGVRTEFKVQVTTINGDLVELEVEANDMIEAKLIVHPQNNGTAHSILLSHNDVENLVTGFKLFCETYEAGGQH